MAGRLSLQGLAGLLADLIPTDAVGDSDTHVLLSPVIAADWCSAFAEIMAAEDEARRSLACDRLTARGATGIRDLQRLLEICTESSEPVLFARNILRSRISGLLTSSSHLDRAIPSLGEILHLPAVTGIDGLARLTPETHRGGLSPLQLTVGNRLAAYKPRSSATAMLWDAMATEARRIGVPVPLSPERVDFGTYYVEGWVGDVHSHCDPIHAIQVLAAASAVAAVLFMTDLHSENLMPREDGVRPIDVETMFQTQGFDVEVIDTDWFAEALLRTGILVEDRFAGCTALGVMRKGRPPLSLTRFSEGFARCVRSYAPKLIEIVPEVVEAFVASRGDVDVRTPLRTTRWYAGVLRRAFVGSERSVESQIRERLACHRLSIEGWPREVRSAIEETECQALLRGDVPVFELSIQSGVLRDSAGDQLARVRGPAPLERARGCWGAGSRHGLALGENSLFTSKLRDQLAASAIPAKSSATTLVASADA